MEPKYFDIHAHAQFDAYDADRDEVISRSLAEGVHMMNVGVDAASSQKAIDLSEKYDGLYAAVALHPTDAVDEVFNPALYEKLASHPKVKAIGECGLDYFRLDPTTDAGQGLIQKQKEIFIQQIELANKLNLPLMCHIRNAYKDAADILRTHAKVKGDIHFFAGTWEEAQWFLDLGFTLSFTGVLTFTKDYDEVVRNTPLDMLMAETDCPFVTPAPCRGKRNEPVHVREVYKAIARIKGLEEETVRGQINANAQRVFGF